MVLNLEVVEHVADPDQFLRDCASLVISYIGMKSHLLENLCKDQEVNITLEEQVEDQMGGKKKKRKDMNSAASGTVASIGGIEVNLGDLKGYDSGSGESI